MTPTRWTNLSSRNLWDVKEAWTDSRGDRWLVSFSFKAVKGQIWPSELMVEPNGRAVPLTHAVLAELPLTEMAKRAALSERSALLKRPKPSGLSPHVGRTHSDEELKFVAEIYMAAWERRLPVQRTVAEALGVPVSTAIKRIMASRKRGFIPTLPTKGQK